MYLIQIVLLLMLLIGIPAAIIIFFIAALVKFSKTPKGAPERSGRAAALTVSAVLLILLIAGIIFLAISFTLAMNHM